MARRTEPLNSGRASQDPRLCLSLLFLLEQLHSSSLGRYMKDPNAVVLLFSKPIFFLLAVEKLVSFCTNMAFE